MNSNYRTSVKTGILGGTFDPVHNGHLNIASNLCRAGVIRQVIFMPAARPPHKTDSDISSGAQRLAMLNLATEEYENFFVSDYELNCSGISYTINTAEYFSRIFGENLYLIIGMDSLGGIHTWSQARKLTRDFQFIVYDRPGELPDKHMLIESLGQKIADKLTNSVITGSVLDISSTEIRNHLQNGNEVSALVAPKVLNYINRNKLYMPGHD